MPRSFDEFVSSRGGVLWRTAWLLTGDPARAEQVLATALARVWSSTARGDDGPAGLEDEALTVLVRACVPRRGGDEPLAPTDWSAAARPDWTADDEQTIRARHELLAALGLLTPRQRAAVVLLHAERRPPPVVAALLGVRTEAVERLHAAACAVLRGTPLLLPPGTEPARPPPDPAALDRAEEHRLRTWLEAGVPSPPYVPSRAADAERQARRARRRTVLAVGAGALLLLAPLGLASVRGLGPDDASPGATSPAAGQRRLIEAPVPPRCAALPASAAAPDLPLDIDQASVAWLRFCGPAFAPATAVVGSLDPVVGSWVSRPGVGSCPYQTPADDGTARLQLGTQDGQIHVVDLVIGACGAVEVDGEPVAVSGREVFAQAVGALGRQLLELTGSDRPAETFAVPRCPIDPMSPQTAARRTVPDYYPATDGLAMPLPAVAALVCRYEPVRGALPRLVDSVQVGSADAEQIRAAYLAHGRRAHPPCVDDPGPLFAAVLVDATGSWRSLGFDTGACDALVGPDYEVGTAGQWLVERVRYAEPARSSLAGWRQPLGAIAPPNR